MRLYLRNIFPMLALAVAFFHACKWCYRLLEKSQNLHNKINLWCKKALNFPLKLIFIWSALSVTCLGVLELLFKLTLTCIQNVHPQLWRRWYKSDLLIAFFLCPIELQLLSMPRWKIQCLNQSRIIFTVPLSFNQFTTPHSFIDSFSLIHVANSPLFKKT